MTKIKDSFYSKEDSREIRKLFFEMKKKSKPTKMPELVTQKEWNRLSAAGSNMQRYEVWTDWVKRMDKLERDRRVKIKTQP